MSRPLALVIEDDSDIATIFAMALREADFHAEMIHNGGQALRRLVEVVPNLIILDLNLPSVSGVEILRVIRADSQLADVPVIVATADPRMGENVREMADLTLLKPISYEQLRDLVRRFR